MNRRLVGLRTALIVCHAMSMAMTVVLPVPVAILRAIRERPGLASSLACFMCCKRSRPGFEWRATSVSQMAVSTASIWQKKGLMLEKRCDRQ